MKAPTDAYRKRLAKRRAVADLARALSRSDHWTRRVKAENLEVAAAFRRGRAWTEGGELDD